MTLKKWIESLEDFADYTYYLYMGEGFYTELTLDEVINGRHSNHQRFVIKIEENKIYITLKKPWSHKGRFRR